MIDYKNELNPQQLEAVTTINGPVAINAGAGSGKTRVLTYRTMYLIEHGINPKNILLLTFTNKAADEMKQRICSLVPFGDNVTASTFHSFCVSILRRYGALIGVKHFTVLAPGDASDVLKMIRAKDEKEKYPKGFPSSSIVATILSTAVNTKKTVEETIDKNYKRYKDYSKTIQELIEKYNEYRRKNNTLNYDDLLTRTLELFDTHPRVVKKLAKEYKYIMVDEYQDSNVLQELLLFHFVKYHNNIAIVGDAVQSLYGFRGADIRNILDFSKQFDSCKTVYLNRNYRSTQGIIDFTNKVTEKSHETQPHSLVAENEDLTMPTVVMVEDRQMEAEWIVEQIKHELKYGTAPEDICVLSRTSTPLGFVEGLLNKEKIPYIKYGGRKFFEMNHIKDIMSFLRISVNSNDEIAWFRCALQVAGVGDSSAQRIAALCKKDGIDGMIDYQFSKRSFHDGLVELHDFMKKTLPSISTADIHPLIERYCEIQKKSIENGNYKKEETRQQKLKALQLYKEDFQVLEEIAKMYPTIPEFLDSTIDNTVTTENPKDCVVLSTVHSSKGLEFESVFIMDCIDEVFPTTTVDEVGTPTDESELRCFYVACTRAKSSLYILCPKKKVKNTLKYTYTESSDLSHFMPEDSFYDVLDLTCKRAGDDDVYQADDNPFGDVSFM